ncbi:MAG: hypothetical protein IJW49_02310 [Clostridia bacterium]|nr:hypothetical protein [Clostridia bacterium]
MSFLPIVKLDIAGDNADEVNSLMKEMDITDVDVPENVEISAVKLIKSVILMIDIVTMPDMEDDSLDAEKEREALLEKIKGEEGRDTLMTAMALVASAGGALMDDDNGEASGGFFSLFFEVIIILICLFGVLGMIIVLPLSMLWKVIKSMYAAFTNLKMPEQAVSKMGDSLTGFLVLILTLMAFQSMLPGMTYASGAMGILIIAIASAVINMIISRLRRYEKGAFIYLNVVQGISVVGVVGFCIFFFNMLKANIFTSFINGTYGSYLAGVAGLELISKGEIEISHAYMIDGILVLMLWGLLLATISYLSSCTSRFACVMKKGGDCLLGGAIIATIIALIPHYLLSAEHNYSDPTDTSSAAESFLHLDAMELEALDMVLVGAIIMLAAEIVLLILKKTACKGVSEEEMANVVAGITVEPTPVAPATEAAPAAEETVAASAEATEETQEN